MGVTARMKICQVVFFLIVAYLSQSFGKHFLIETADVKNGDYNDGLDMKTADAKNGDYRLNMDPKNREPKKTTKDHADDEEVTYSQRGCQDGYKFFHYQGEHTGWCCQDLEIPTMACCHDSFDKTLICPD